MRDDLLPKDLLGREGEQLAVMHLRGKGFEILDRNWRCRQGELDVVAVDGDCLVFCEVKTRRSVRYGAPLEAINSVKAARIRRLAAAWLDESPLAQGRHWRELRFDVVGVLCPLNGPAEFAHVEAAF